MQPTETYLALMSELERRRQKLKMPMWLLDDKSGGQDGYFGKMLACHAPSGRQAGWNILQLYVTALFPKGVSVKLIPCRKPNAQQPSMNGKSVREIERSKIDLPQELRLLLRERAKEAGRKGAAARNGRLSARQRRALARKAAVIRWSAIKAAAKGKAKAHSTSKKKKRAPWVASLNPRAPHPFGHPRRAGRVGYEHRP
jgi:hypothetical protein